MKKELFECLTDVEEIKKIITIDDLVNKEDRTLLYGYTCDRDTWHVYIKNNKIFSVIYTYKTKPMPIPILDNESYIPNKRLYPETCDYEFCKLLKEQGVYLPFTTWQDRPENVYYGELLDTVNP